MGQAIAAFAWLAGCGASEGPLLHALDGGPVEGGAARDARAPGAPVAIGQDVAWQYQLVGQVDPDLGAQLFMIDLETEDDVIAALHARGKLAIAYISAGTFEPFRDDAGAFPERAIGKPLAAYPEESWLDVRDAQVRARMAARLDRARDQGFDGVLPTNLAGYMHDTGFDLSAADQLDYARWFAAEAHRRLLAVGMADDFGRVAELVQHFDLALQVGCVARGACPAAPVFAAQGKPVFDVEVEGDPAEICPRAAELGVNAIRKEPNFGAFLVGCR